MEGSSTSVHVLQEAGAVPESSSCTCAGQPLCGVGWLLALLSFLLHPFPWDTWSLHTCSRVQCSLLPIWKCSHSPIYRRSYTDSWIR